MEELKLCFIKYVGEDFDGANIYEFLFTEDIDNFWGENFEYMPCCLCNELIPNKEDYTVSKRLKTHNKLNLIQESCCFSFQDAADKIVSIGFSYDDNDKLIVNFMFGDDYSIVIDKINNMGAQFDNE